MTRPRMATVIAWLALAEGVLGILVAFVWFQVASFFAPESGGMSMLMSMMAMGRGWSVMALALMYFVFAAGAWQIKAWAWWFGLLLSVLSILTFVSVLLKGGSVVITLLFMIIPVIIMWYILSPTGRQVYTR
jgi:hypothetical protein